MEFKNLIYEKEDGIVRITLNRPKALNALNGELIAELNTLFDALAMDDGVRVVLLTGAGDKAFVAGADISELAHMDSFSARIFADAGQSMMAKIALLPMPVIAVVNGFALGGGCELALACDFIYASEKAMFGLPEETLGLIPGFGGTQRLARRVGAAMAMELIFTAKRIKAEEAKELGLVNRVLPAEQLMEEAQKTAASIAAMGPAAIALAKVAVHKGIEVDLISGSYMEREAFGLCFASSDAKEGTSAFLEKRKAVFSKTR
ncbi:enoyl-CoA hydratase-related protein [Desulfobotulus mexicanus]|uniref:Enoyl-CoA hydratase/isomerase family protein n=1 Tax=Desulfobotulus mexicanus TaxID=2586642 RepID=A0A5S5MD62_9BACT|nr:enoyl-CoA hydratase-related protein [Desulfobotulus mexicanus]TYT73654.1 enoyl-CoA hydratase/isomerase family protein [Desulfobotulus mexicanus]